MRLSATRSLIEREDVIIVSSVSCIYGLGLPEYYSQMQLTVKRGKKHGATTCCSISSRCTISATTTNLSRGTFRARGDVFEIMPAYEENLAYRIEFFGDEIERINAIDPLTGKVHRANRRDRHFPRLSPRHAGKCPLPCARHDPRRTEREDRVF